MARGSRFEVEEQRFGAGSRQIEKLGYISHINPSLTRCPRHRARGSSGGSLNVNSEPGTQSQFGPTITFFDSRTPNDQETQRKLEDEMALQIAASCNGYLIHLF